MISRENKISKFHEVANLSGKVPMVLGGGTDVFDRQGRFRLCAGSIRALSFSQIVEIEFCLNFMKNFINFIKNSHIGILFVWLCG
jgi:hypothetical protein